MRGRGESFGAVSVLNAMFCGTGAVIGVNLRTTAEFEDGCEDIIIECSEDPALASICVRRTLERIGADPDIGYRLRIRSEIPASMGLKSSSSVCNAVILSVLDRYGVHLDPMEILDINVDSSKEAGVTVTGSFDDACGCMLGGFVKTDNIGRRVLERRDIEDYDVIVSIPGGRKSRVDPSIYRDYSDEAEFLKDVHPLDCMDGNGLLMENICSSNGICSKAMSLGAIASSVSGTGPAVATLAFKGEGKDIAEKLGCEYILTSTRPSCLMFYGGKVEGTLTPPASKSRSHRAILLASLAKGTSRIRGCLRSADVESTKNAVRSMGVDMIEEGEDLIVTSNGLRPPKDTIDAGNSGTTMRFISAISSMFDTEVTVTGDASLKARPMEPLLEALRGAGAECTIEDGKVTVRGPLKGDRIEVDSLESSQFVSSLLMIAPLLRDTEIIVKGETPSRPFIGLSIEMMRRFGVEVETTSEGFRVKKQDYVPCDYRVPSDMSSMAFPLVAGALSGGVKLLTPLDEGQGDSAIVDILRAAGADVDTSDDRIICRMSGRPKAMDIDFRDVPDLFPIVAVLLSTADGTSRLYGASRLRFKESDRISSTAEMLRSLGADVEENDDGLTIIGKESLDGGFVDHRGDHRIMMSAAVASLVCRRPVYMVDDGCWKISYPDFVSDMRSLGMEVL